MKQFLAQLEAWLRTYRPAYLESLQQGASELALETFEARFKVQLPEACKLLYRWRDGQSPSDFSSLQGNRMFSSLAEITSIKDMLDGMIGTDFDDPAWWQTAWVPFLANGAGDYLCLDTKTNELIAFWHDWDDRSREFPSLEAWLEELVRETQSGELEFDV